MTDYNKIIRYLYSRLPVFQRSGAAAYKAGLDNTFKLSRLTGCPERSFPSVHVAGTNGKGSVSNMLSAILQSAGYKTGLYTSPHLKDFRERIRVNGKMISKKAVVDFTEKYRREFEIFSPSFFEVTFAMAMKYFDEHKVEVAVVETGMGGRLDSTNIVVPVLSVITNIGYDHIQFLGNTLTEIAAEKAGIIKNGIPVIIGQTQNEIRQVFEETAKRNHAEIIFADQMLSIENVRYHDEKYGLSMDLVHGKEYKINKLQIELGGHYQLKNIPAVVASCMMLIKAGYNIHEKHIRKGIADVRKLTGFRGRWEVLNKNPLTICDTAHNADGIAEVVQQLKTLRYKKLHFVFGVVNDKDLSEIFSLLPHNATYYFCKPDIPRGLDSTLLLLQSANTGLKGLAYQSVNEALKAAKNAAGQDDLIFIGGSIFVVAEII